MRLPAVALIVVCVALGCAGLAKAAETKGGSEKPMPGYEEVVRRLRNAIEHEMQAKKLPAFSIALVDGEQLAWAAGFGHQDAARQTPATADTAYRVGSVSKLFTDIAIMQLVEQDKLDLDAPITKYLPDFAPQNSREGKITLRQLMGHRSGLVREPPVGHYTSILMSRRWRRRSPA